MTDSVHKPNSFAKTAFLLMQKGGFTDNNARTGFQPGIVCYKLWVN